MKRSITVVFLAGAMLAGVAAAPAQASHSWNGYHWSRSANPFTLRLGDNVTSQWDAYLSEASADWTKSSVLDTVVAAGSVSNVRKCSPATGKVEICNTTYGNNGWLGIAGISLSGGHITKGYVKLNDTYFNTPTYNRPEWRRLVVCQEVGHIFGLDHQDENFNNANLGTCMDYTNSPLGPPSNEHPNQHDYDQLISIYSHLDGGSGGGQSPGRSGQRRSRSRVENVDAHGNGTVTWTFWTS